MRKVYWRYSGSRVLTTRRVTVSPRLVAAVEIQAIRADLQTLMTIIKVTQSPQMSDAIAHQAVTVTMAASLFSVHTVRTVSWAGMVGVQGKVSGTVDHAEIAKGPGLDTRSALQTRSAALVDGTELTITL